MSTPIHTGVRPELQETDGLAELALNLRSIWSHKADELWGRIDPDLWELTQNPWVVLQTASQDRLQAVLAEPAFRKKVEELLAEQREETIKPGWFQNAYAGSPLSLVAYFSMEYMLSEALPIYSGGLGNVARGPTEGSKRSGGARRRHWSSVSAGIFSPGDRCERITGVTVSVQWSRTTT